MQDIKEQSNEQVLYDLLKIDEVAMILRVGEKTVFRLIWNKKIKVAKIGGQWRFRPEWIDEYIERQSEEQSIAI